MSDEIRGIRRPPPKSMKAFLLDADAEVENMNAVIASSLAQRVRRIAFEGPFSLASVVEIALRSYFGKSTDEEIVAALRAAGASQRRRK
jgi:hypothetical protein